MSPREAWKEEGESAPREQNGSPERQPITPEEFDHLLDELAEPAPLPELPTDYSRVDIYADHD